MSKIKVRGYLVLKEGPLPGLQTATFSLHSHMVEKDRALLFLLLLTRVLILSWGNLP